MRVSPIPCALIGLLAAGCRYADLGPAPAQAAAASRGPDASSGPVSVANSLPAEISSGDPRSDSVKLKLWVLPVTADVVWGARKLGTAGREPLEIERPRNSGPLDIVVRAAGYLPFHTRLLTDRDDTLTVRLITPSAAPGLLGYRRAAPGTHGP
jgi:hypothetical protein